MVVIQVVISILLAILIFGVMILVHEFGHYFTAKLSGVRVNEFALGMGPVLFKFKKGETQYSLRAFPIGGFCSMEGEDKDSTDERAFNKIAVWKRIIIVCAGAVMNILLGFVVIIIIMSTQNGLSSTTIAEFDKTTSLSNKTGLQVGDQIVRINGSKVNVDVDITFDLMAANSNNVDMVVKRNNKLITLDNVKFPMVSDGNGGKVMQRDFWVYAENKNPVSVIRHSFYWTIATVKFVWVTLFQLVTGRYSLKDLAGPVGTTAAIGQAASYGIQSLLLVVALITVNLGVVNLLPLPALDGGRLFFLIIEAIRRKPIKPEVEGYIHFVGFVLLMVLVVVVTFNDIARLNFFKFFQGIFKR